VTATFQSGPRGEVVEKRTPPTDACLFTGLRCVDLNVKNNKLETAGADNAAELFVPLA
jgi:hypothetical protein